MFNKPGQLEVKALLAGNDILLCPEKVSVAIDSIEKAIKDSVLMQSDIDYRCKKVLEAKYWAGLNKMKAIDLKNITSDLNKPENYLLLRKLYEAAATVLINKQNTLPIKQVDTLCIAALSIGEKESPAFQKMLNNYSPMTNILLQNEDFKNNKKSIKDTLIGNNLVIIGLHCKSTKASKNYGISAETVAFIDSLANVKNVIMAVMGNPYVLKSFKNIKSLKGLIVGYQNEEIDQEVMAQVIFGAVKVNGRLPVSVSDDYPVGFGLDLEEVIRFKYTIPEEVGIASIDLKRIDSIALNGIDKKAYPGCQILVAKDGKVIYNKCFGFHTYSVETPVRLTDLYDIASVTKLAATTLSVMMLDNQKKINTDDYLSKYITLPNNTSLYETDLKSMLSHIARLTPWIPFYKDYFLVSDSVRNTIVSKVPKQGFTLRIADSMYVSNAYRDSVYSQIFHSKLLHKDEYKYSDLGFYLLKEVVENKTGKTLDNYASDNYYKTLGLTTICFNPIDKFEKNRIIPTEDDKIFRKQLIQGYVHDQGAALLGGVSGHAGLFSNANDLAIIMQMLLNNGTYGGTRFFDEDIMKKYNKRHYESLGNRRGLGFDKPAIGGGGPVSELASDKSFGHSGFTGTLVWADPEENLVYIFLSNRVYPDVENNKLRDMNIRTEIQKTIYEAIQKGKINKEGF